MQIQCLREVSSYHHSGKKIVWKYYEATISIGSPTNSGVKISISLKVFRICHNICTLFGGFDSYRPVCLKKNPKFGSFLFESIWKHELWNIKSQFSLKLLVFLRQVMKRCALPFFGNHGHNQFLGKLPCYIWTWRLKFYSRHKIPKRCFFPSVHFSNYWRQNVPIWIAPTYRWDPYENLGVWKRWGNKTCRSPSKKQSWAS